MTAEGRLARVGVAAQNWAGVADWIHQHYCWERQRTGSCHHKSCLHAAQLEDSASAIDVGEQADHVLADFVKFTRRKQCHNPTTCNHKGCAQAAGVIEWLIASEQVKKVA